jgi:hypothetical protein
VLVTIGGKFGWTIFAIVWILAICGIVYKSLMIDKHNVASAVLLSCDGLAYIILYRSALACAPFGCHLVADRWWSFVYRRHDIFLFRRYPLFPFDLAPVCPRREHLPLFFDLAVRYQIIGLLIGP